MSVEKFNPSISGESIPYVQANTHVIQNIDNLEALAVWIYLLTLPKDWLVMKSHIKKHFGIGDDKIKRIFAYLKRCGLIEYVRERDEKGKLRKSEIKVLNGTRFINPKKPTGVKTTPLENHTCGKHPTTKNIKKQIKQKEKIIHIPTWLSAEVWDEFKQYRIERKKPMTPLAEKKLIKELTKLKEKGNDPVEVLNRSILNNWTSVYELNKNVFPFKPNKEKSNELRSTVQFYGPGHPDYDRINKISTNERENYERCRNI